MHFGIFFSTKSGEFAALKKKVPTFHTPCRSGYVHQIRKGVVCRWVHILLGCNPIFLYYKDLWSAILKDSDRNIVSIRSNLLNLPQKVQFRNRTTNEYSTMLQAWSIRPGTIIPPALRSDLLVALRRKILWHLHSKQIIVATMCTKNRGQQEKSFWNVFWPRKVILRLPVESVPLVIGLIPIHWKTTWETHGWPWQAIICLAIPTRPIRLPVRLIIIRLVWSGATGRIANPYNTKNCYCIPIDIGTQ